MEKINFIPFYVYMHTFPNKKVYIGITHQNPNRRWRKDGIGYKKQTLMYNAILKYGWGNIKHEILYTNLTKEEAEQKEIELIKQYKSNDRKYGYNIANGGNCQETMSNQTKEKIRQKLKGNKNAKGYIRTKEQREISKLVNLGNKNMLGKHHSKEAKEKMRKARLGKKMSLKTKIKKSKPVIMYDKKMNFINEYYGMSEAHKQTGISIKGISQCCNGKLKTSGGYIWEFKKGDEDLLIR